MLDIEFTGFDTAFKTFPIQEIRLSAMNDVAAFHQAAATLSTAEISDALDALRLPGSVPGIGHIAGGKRLFGPAFTVRYAPVNLAAPGTVGDYLDDTPPGAVVVLDNGGR